VRNFDRYMNGCIWLFVLGTCLVIAGPLLAVAATDDDPAALVFAAVFALLLPAVMLPIMLLVFWLQSRRKKDPRILGLLEPLRQELGGELVLPSVFTPLLQPRLITRVQGVELEIRFFPIRSSAAGFVIASFAEEQHARFAAPLWTWAWRMTVHAELPVPYRVAAVTRTRLAGIGTGLAGLHAFSLGDADLDRTFACYSTEPERARLAFSDPHLRRAWIELLTINAPYLTNVSFGPRKWYTMGAHHLTVLPERLTPATILRIVESFFYIAGRLREGPASFRQPAAQPAPWHR
jgi:hypothetical protein